MSTMKAPEREFRHQRCATQSDGAGHPASIAKPAARACSPVAQIDVAGSED